MTDTPPLWLVWNPNARLPRYEHGSRDSAAAEAKRLAKLHPGERFYVMEPIGAAMVEDPVKWIEFDSDEMPF